MKKHLRVINDDYWAPDIVLFCVNIFYAAVNGGIPSQAWIFPSLHSVKKKIMVMLVTLKHSFPKMKRIHVNISISYEFNCSMSKCLS